MKDTYQTQIQKLKAEGRYGSVHDHTWDRKEKRHTCCGTRRAYYHLKGCTVATRPADDLSDLKDVK